jgi:hypothetical protein
MPERYIGAELREAVRIRANGLCEYCRSQECFSPQPFSVEHIMPRSMGGEGISENLAFSCQGCNGHKYTKVESLDPATHALVPLYHPRRHLWRDHFVWSPDGISIFGLTPIGRATIAALQMNRRGLVNLREVLRRAGKHPPADPDLP